MTNFKQTPCECVLTKDGQEPLDLVLKIIVNNTSNFGMEFQINDIAINSSMHFGYASVMNRTKLLFSTHESHETDRICLAVFTSKCSIYIIFVVFVL